MGNAASQADPRGYCDQLIQANPGLRAILAADPSGTTELQRLDGSGVAVDIEPQADSLYILLGEHGNCKYLHGIAAAGKGSMLASHRDSSAHLHAASNGKLALPDFTLVTTHVGVIEVGGENVGRVRIATVHWGHSSDLRPFIQQGVTVPSAAHGL